MSATSNSHCLGSGFSIFKIQFTIAWARLLITRFHRQHVSASASSRYWWFSIFSFQFIAKARLLPNIGGLQYSTCNSQLPWEVYYYQIPSPACFCLSLFKILVASKPALSQSCLAITWVLNLIRYLLQHDMLVYSWLFSFQCSSHDVATNLKSLGHCSDDKLFLSSNCPAVVAQVPLNQYIRAELNTCMRWCFEIGERNIRKTPKAQIIDLLGKFHVNSSTSRNNRVVLHRTPAFWFSQIMSWI